MGLEETTYAIGDGSYYISSNDLRTAFDRLNREYDELKLEYDAMKLAVSFYDEPYRVVDRYFYNLGAAFDFAWEFGVDVIYLNGKHLDGYAHPNDILEVHEKRWRVTGIEAAADGGIRYKLERDNRPNPLGTVWTR